MPIQLIALDLDDTLLHSDLSISAANQAAIAEARRRGIRVVLASGRNYHSMKKYAATLGLDIAGEYLICSNGSEVLRADTGESVYERMIDGELCVEVAKAVKDRGFAYQIYEEGRIRAAGESYWTSEDTRLTGQVLDPIQPTEEEAFLRRGHLKFVVPGHPERISVLLEQMTALLSGRAEVLISKPYFLEVLPYGVDKGSALEFLAATLGLDMENVLAIGDSMNDAGMLRAAGIGCAPANALPAARDSADYICDATHDEDAVAKIIAKFIDSGSAESED